MTSLIHSPARYCVFIFLVILVIIGPVTALTLNAGEARSSTPSIAKGDPVYVRGIATGRPQQGLQIWLIGNNYAQVTTTSVASDSSFEYELTSSDTRNLDPGQYFVLIQHPMMNGQFDIIYNAATGQVINRQQGNGMAIFTLTGAGSLQSSDAASALISAVNSQNVDDMFSTVTFFISEPGAFIDFVGEHAVGEKFTITGTTNLAVGDELMVEVYSSSFAPTGKGQPNEFSGKSGIVKVQTGSGSSNRWSFDIDASAFRPDEYIVNVRAINQQATGTTTFTIVPYRIKTTVLTTIPMAPTTLPGTVTTLASIPSSTTKATPLPVWITGAALTAALLIAQIPGRNKV
ncbi:MAG: hypothetical protein OS112_05550 [Methanoregula sp.]|nr:MAG: hypothetical protein OS112_05550 [Methanoregula sp.]